MPDAHAPDRQNNALQARPFVVFSASFAFSALCVMLFFSSGVWVGAVVAAVIAAALAGVMLAVPRARLWVIPAGMLLGALWCSGFLLIKYVPAALLDGTTDYITFVCDGYSAGYGDYGAVNGRIVELGGKRVNFSARLYVDDGSPGFEPGDRLELAAAIYAVERSAANYNITSGRFITASQKGSLTYLPGVSTGLRHWGARTARAIGDTLAKMLDGDEAGLLIALLTGDRSRYSRDFNAALMNSGTSHITAVSGMHITILVGIMTALLGKRAGVFAALPAVLLFSAISGFVPSIMRAAIMCGVTALAFALRREGDTLTSLFAALFLLLLVNPFSVTAASLTLSFVSTFGIILFAPMLQRGMRRRLPRLKGGAARALDILCTTTAAAIAPMAATLPLCALYFPRVSLISALATQLVLPALTLTMALGIIVAVLAPFWYAGAALLARYVLRRPLKLMLDSIMWLGGKKWVASSASIYFALAIITLAAVMIAARGKKLRAAASFAIVSTAFCAFFALTALESRLYADISVSGTNGSAIILVRTPGGAYAVNSGGVSRGRSAAFIDDTLAGWGYAYLDAVVLTSDSYRDTGGLEQTLERVGAGKIYLPEGQSVRADTEEIIWYSASGALELDGFSVELYAAGEGRYIPRVSAGGVSVVNLCGVTPIVALAAMAQAPPCDILLVDKNYAGSPGSFSKLCDALLARAVVVCEDSYTGTAAFGRVFSGQVASMDDIGELKIKMLVKQ